MRCVPSASASRDRVSGMTLIELLVSTTIGLIVITAAGLMWIFVLRSFVAAGNYADLDAKSRIAVDTMLSEIRESSSIVGYRNNGSNNWLSLTNFLEANSGITYTWTADSRTLSRQKTGEPDRVYLTECDAWDFQLFQRTPHPGGMYVFYPATNASGTNDATIAKLINMSWRCSRTILGQKRNTENVQTAQVVLRNKS
jgi:hypothetical protein